MIPVTTTFTIEGYRIKEYRGIVRGIIVRAPTIAQGFLGGLKSIVGGKIGAYTEMCEQTRQQAYELVQKAALTARDQGGDFRQLLGADPAISGRLAKADLDACFDLGHHLRHADLIIDRALSDGDDA